MAVLHDDEQAEEFDAPRQRFPRAKAIVAGTCLLLTIWLARDLPFARWLGLHGSEPPPPVVAARPVTASSTTPPVPTVAPLPQAQAAAVPVTPPPQAQAQLQPPAADEPVPVGTDPSRATLIDQIGALQMQLVLARLKRELAQAQAEASKLAPDAGGDAGGVEALLDRMAERDGRGGARSALAVQAVFGRDGDWAARLSLPGEGSRVVRVGEILADRWRVDSIDERAVVLVSVRGDARQVLRPGAGLPHGTDGDGDEPAPARAKPASAPAPTPAQPPVATPATSSDAAAMAQAPVAGSMLRPTAPR